MGDDAPRIADHALIGDCHSAALVARDGSVTWACFPRFDSPAVFCAVLDPRRGGAFRVGPAKDARVDHTYIEDTNVLVTLSETPSGVLEVTDCMPVARLDPALPSAVASRRSILRRVHCVAGEVEAEVLLWPRFEYGSFAPRFRLPRPTVAEIVGGADGLLVRATHPLGIAGDAVRARWRLRAGETAWIEAGWHASHEPRVEVTDPDAIGDDCARRLDGTIAFWRSWIDRCWYEGPHADAVRRSALVLKALTYAPTGAVVAAPTTSLPEAVGGARNWDYRYTWIRDATLTLTSLFVLGFGEEAEAFKGWLERTGAGRPEDIQIMYGIGGERSLPELELAHLDGHRGSAPVRVGNGAVKQLQLDAYGQILEAAHLFGKAGGTLTADNWRFLSGLTDIVCERWRRPDQGIWGIRDEPRHFVHSKLNCWIALDRAVRVADALALEAPVERWAAERDAIRDALLEESMGLGWFPQALGHHVADASALLVPAAGFLPTSDPLVHGTIEAVLRDLGSDGLMHRYRAPDGLGGGEGAFLLCSFWLVDCLIHAGIIDEAEALLDRLLALRNDVGLLAEEADPETGEALGNFPQAFSHMALVLSCAHLGAARRGEIPDGAHSYAELALSRLLARRGSPLAVKRT